MTRKEFTDLLTWIHAEVPDASRTLARLRRQRQTPFLRVLLGTILSHQTTSRQTRLATERLWKSYQTVEGLAEAEPAQIARLIRNVGLEGIKARRVVAIRGEDRRTVDERDAAGAIREVCAPGRCASHGDWVG